MKTRWWFGLGVVAGMLAVGAGGSDKATSIISGETKAGSIAGPSYSQAWTFEGTQDQRVLITAVATTGTLNTEIILYPPGGGAAETSTVSFNDDRVDWQLRKTGTYTILIQDDGLNDAGEYLLNLLTIPAPYPIPGPDLDGGPLASGETRTGTITAADVDAWKFYGEAGERVLITAVTTAGDLNTEIILYPPGGGARETSTVSFNDDRVDWQLQTTGIHTIVIQDDAYDHAGSYLVNLLKIPGAVSTAGDPDGGLLASGGNRSGTMALGEVDAFQFYAVAGERVIILAVKTAGDLNTEIILYPPGGGARETSTVSFNEDRLDWQVRQTGLYTIVIQDDAYDHTGSYDVSFTKIPDASWGLSSPYPGVGESVPRSAFPLTWVAVPSDGGTVSGYDVYFGQGDGGVLSPLPKIASNHPTASYPVSAVQPGTMYRWRVVAHTATGDIEGPYWWFIGASRCHPADSNQDGTITADELTAYGAAWKAGTTWPTPPNPIAIDHVSRAGFLWRSGEHYRDNGSSEPLCWEPGQ